MRQRLRVRAIVVVSAVTLAAVCFVAVPGALGTQGTGAGRQGAAALKPLTDAASLAQGKVLYEGVDYLCATCHNKDLGGLVGPNLVDEFWAHGCSVTDVVTAIEKGFPATGMLPFGSNKPMTAVQLHQLASYVLSQRGTKPAIAKPQDPAKEKPCT